MLRQKMEMTMKTKKPANIFVITIFTFFCLFTTNVSAHQLSVLLGPSYEVITVRRDSYSRLTPTSFLAQYERQVVNQLYFSLGLSSQIDIATVSVVSFGFYGSGRYYLMGRPDRRESFSDGTHISLSYPYSFFVGLGAFNKEVNFEDLEKESVGGLSLQCGGTFQYTKRFYINWLANVLYQGERNRVSYTNIEAYVGLGFWL